MFKDGKPFEDKIDALVCAWVGTLYVEGNASPLGNDHSAIWVQTTQPYNSRRRSQGFSELKLAMSTFAHLSQRAHP